jgi:hypothetical protein
MVSGCRCCDDVAQVWVGEEAWIMPGNFWSRRSAPTALALRSSLLVTAALAVLSFLMFFRTQSGVAEDQPWLGKSSWRTTVDLVLRRRGPLINDLEDLSAVNIGQPHIRLWNHFFPTMCVRSADPCEEF